MPHTCPGKQHHKAEFIRIGIKIDKSANDGYVGVMKRANISYTRNHFSEILAQVREGESITIMDRQHPVARIEPIRGVHTPGPSWKEALARRGLLHTADAAIDMKALKAIQQPTPEKGGDILAVLTKDRENGR